MSALTDRTGILRRRRLWTIGAVTAFALALGACEDVAIPVTAEFERSWEFTWDAASPTSDEATVARDEIVGDLDLDQDITTPDVDIQQLSLSLTPGAENEATQVTVQYSYLGLPMTDPLVLDVTALDSEPMLALIAAQIQRLRDDFEGILADLPTAPASITVTGEILDIQPTGALLVLDATVDVLATVSFEGCVPLGLGIVGPEAECDPSVAGS